MCLYPPLRRAPRQLRLPAQSRPSSGERTGSGVQTDSWHVCTDTSEAGMPAIPSKSCAVSSSSTMPVCEHAAQVRSNTKRLRARKFGRGVAASLSATMPACLITVLPSNPAGGSVLNTRPEWQEQAIEDSCPSFSKAARCVAIPATILCCASTGLANTRAHSGGRRRYVSMTFDLEDEPAYQEAARELSGTTPALKDKSLWLCLHCRSLLLLTGLEEVLEASPTSLAEFGICLLSMTPWAFRHNVLLQRSNRPVKLHTHSNIGSIQASGAPGNITSNLPGHVPGHVARPCPWPKICDINCAAGNICMTSATNTGNLPFS